MVPSIVTLTQHAEIFIEAEYLGQSPRGRTLLTLRNDCKLGQNQMPRPSPNACLARMRSACPMVHRGSTSIRNVLLRYNTPLCEKPVFSNGIAYPRPLLCQRRSSLWRRGVGGSLEGAGVFAVILSPITSEKAFCRVGCSSAWLLP